MELVAGIDSSTQSCKVVIADAVSGTVVREGRAAHPPGTEVDPEAWWQALQQAIAAAGGLGDVRAWAISGQQHGMVALDSRGRVVRPALLWNDLRSSDAATALIARYGATALAERTGLVPVPSFTLTKVHWLREHEPEHARAVGAVALPHDWLTWRLRGFGPDSRLGADLDELVTDRSEASGTGYWTDAGYDRELFAEALGHDAVLPRVLAHDAAVRDADGRSVGPGSGDNAGAALGLGARVGDVVVSIGTSGTVFATSAHRTIDPSERLPDSPTQPTAICRSSRPSAPRGCSTRSPPSSEWITKNSADSPLLRLPVPAVWCSSRTWRASAPRTSRMRPEPYSA